MGLLKVFSSSFFRRNDQPSSSVYRVGGPAEHGALKVFFFFPVGFSEGMTHQVVPCNHTAVVCVVRGRGGGPAEHGAFKLVFQ